MFDNKQLNSKEVENILNLIKKYYDADISNLKNYFFSINENTRKIFISNFSLDDLGVDLPRINSHGMYFATMHDGGRVRLSIEGSKLISAKKNFIVLNEENLKSYVSGEDLFFDEVEEINKDNTAPFLIVKYKDENIGCMGLTKDSLMTYVPKSRRLEFNRIF